MRASHTGSLEHCEWTLRVDRVVLAGTEKKPLVNSPGEGGASALLTLSSQDTQQATPPQVSQVILAASEASFLGKCVAMRTVHHFHLLQHKTTSGSHCIADHCVPYHLGKRLRLFHARLSMIICYAIGLL